MAAVGGACGQATPRQRRHDSICHRDRPRISLLIAPSSDAASSSNWPNVGVDGVKMAATLFTSMTAACQLHVRISEHRRERQREWEGGR